MEAIRDPTQFQLEKASELAGMLRLDRPFAAPGILLGTSAFTAAGWQGSFYPAGMKPTNFLSYYATQFATVEVDSTFYRTPSASTVNGWYEKTPPDFVFAAKVPQVITHEKVLVDCEAEFDEFIGRMDLLDDKLGPLLLQFPYFNQSTFKSVGEFLPRLRFFLKRLSPADSDSIAGWRGGYRRNRGRHNSQRKCFCGRSGNVICDLHRKCLGRSGWRATDYPARGQTKSRRKASRCDGPCVRRCSS